MRKKKLGKEDINVLPAVDGGLDKAYCAQRHRPCGLCSSTVLKTFIDVGPCESERLELVVDGLLGRIEKPRSN
tara:strand:- start:19098 stop:19316 length:219 start_codon:yes stop_codon:yes gene_type:complete